ncbi:hypothetical protein V493_06202 [Pseudogymnoascus sp. VKM F-4281 (FW-2241)]|nr:hypothetical protein V493_06202 [Pseudogymnoascus sp. VKM F-4281 (FW-2241)]
MHLSALRLASGLSLATVAVAAPQRCAQRQEDSAARAAAVKEAFQFAWEGYYKYAFPNDELRPVTNGFTNSRNGWGASAADALSTALVMEIPEIVNQIVDYIPTVDFSKTDDQVSLFETTIRYLGGMISGYDLLKGPLAHLVPDNKNIESLLTQSKNLADQMKFAFNTPSGVPANTLNLEAQTTDGSETNGLATIGTLVLEWTRLSDLTGDDEYAELSQRGESHLLRPKPEENVPFPGLVGTNVNLTSGEFVDDRGGWGGGDDSFYEYLIKMYIYDPSRFETYKDRWILAADSTIKHLTSHPESRPDLTFVANYDGTNLEKNSGHLTCFDGGNFLLGGSVLKRQDYIDFGLALVNGCRATYTATITQIGPERFSWDASKVPAEQADFYKKNGFYITSPDYVLRPEVIESYYYAYRMTGEQKYREWAWDAFVAINATTRVGSGFSSISDVNAEGGGEKTDFQESFLFAEVMKYAYLIHAEDNVWQVDGKGKNSFVFNTEAHPFQIYEGASE